MKSKIDGRSFDVYKTVFISETKKPLDDRVNKFKWG